MFNQKNFGLNLRILRQKNDLTVENLGSILNVSKQTISRWELGTREPNFETLNQIADFFCISVDYLIGRTDNPQSEYYVQKRVDTLLLDMPSLFITLFKYARTHGFKNEKITHEEHLHLIILFDEWKEFSRQLTSYFDKENSYREKYIYEQKNKSSFKKWFYFFVGEILQGSNKNPVTSSAYKNFDNPLRDRKLNFNLRALLHLDLFTHDANSKTQLYLAPLPDRLTEYLYLITEDDMKHPERRN